MPSKTKIPPAPFTLRPVTNTSAPRSRTLNQVYYLSSLLLTVINFELDNYIQDYWGSHVPRHVTNTLPL